MESYSPHYLQSQRVIARNTILNLVSRLILLPVGILAIPAILHGAGTERFGLLSINWMLLNYFVIFDFGLGQATTRFMAYELIRSRKDTLPQIFWSSSLILLVIGTFTAFCMALMSHWIVNQALHTTQLLAPEGIRMFRILALSVPFAFVNNSLRGALEAAQRFDLVNAVRTPYSASIYISPLIGFLIGWQVDRLSGLLCLTVVVSCLAYLLLCARVYPNLLRKPRIQKPVLQTLFSYSGWVAVTNFISPILTYIDRFLISAVLSVAVLSYYTAPYEGLTRLWIIPMSVTAALFPVFSKSDQDATWESIAKLWKSATEYILLLLGPVLALIIIFPKEILRLWIGSEFAVSCATVAQILAFGIMVNSIGRLPATYLQGCGRPDIPAKLYMVELPLYIIGCWTCLKTWGINGAAFAWTTRVAIDTFLLYALLKRLKNIKPAQMFERQTRIAVGALSALVLIGLLIRQVGISLLLQIGLVSLLIVAFAIISWAWILEQKERNQVLHFFQKLPVSLTRKSREA